MPYSQLPSLYTFIILIYKQVLTCDCCLLVFMSIFQRLSDKQQFCNLQVICASMIYVKQVDLNCYQIISGGLYKHWLFYPVNKS